MYCINMILKTDPEKAAVVKVWGELEGGCGREGMIAFYPGQGDGGKGDGGNEVGNRHLLPRQHTHKVGFNHYSIKALIYDSGTPSED